MENLKEQYVVCHSCQLTGGGIRHCAHPEECGGIKTYPRELRNMVESDYEKKISLSITAEKAFDMGYTLCQTTNQPIKR